jgi:lipoate-protein ligase A
MKLKAWFFQHWPDLELYTPDQADIRSINRIKEDKYIKWEWNFGWSPVYVFKNQILLNDKEISVELKVRKGRVETALVIVEGKKLDEKHVLIKGLENQPHNPDRIEELLAEINFLGFNSLNDSWTLLKLFF